ncbi:hypothetical protein ROZALSC1DRAFT_22420 [Rozella allomycis CSF55]|uniref:SWIM-type domain-containing protein n=1 Tax=Rozella allomycis (strain CSF55) TaxID=988480 RepID=A0A4P9YIV3_ROZAC|nr:hypothetical protein ROZALSC1DRAFT_22420 [Rozella allomycis CSF55]
MSIENGLCSVLFIDISLELGTSVCHPPKVGSSHPKVGIAPSFDSTLVRWVVTLQHNVVTLDLEASHPTCQVITLPKIFVTLVNVGSALYSEWHCNCPFFVKWKICKHISILLKKLNIAQDDIPDIRSFASTRKRKNIGNDAEEDITLKGRGQKAREALEMDE